MLLLACENKTLQGYGLQSKSKVKVMILLLFVLKDSIIAYCRVIYIHAHHFSVYTQSSDLEMCPYIYPCEHHILRVIWKASRFIDNYLRNMYNKLLYP